MKISDVQQRSIKVFCEQSIRKRKIEQDFKDRSKKHKTSIKNCKEKLKEYLQSNGMQRGQVVLPNGTKYYCGFSKRVSQKRYDKDIIEYGIDSFVQSITDEPYSSHKELVEQVSKKICEHINQQRRIEKESFSVGKKKPPKVAASDIAVISNDRIQSLCQGMFSAESTVQKWKKIKKTHLDTIKTELTKTEPQIRTFMDSNKILSQRVTMRDQNTPRCFYIRQKKKTNKPSIKKVDMYNIVLKGVRSALTGEETNVMQLNQDGPVLRSNIVTAFNEMPSTEKVCITLDKGRFRPAEDSREESAAPADSPEDDAHATSVASIFDEEDDETAGPSTVDETISGF